MQAESVLAEAFPGAADIIYFSVFVPLMVIAVRRMVRSGARILDRLSLLDGLIVATALAVLMWACRWPAWSA